MAQIIDTAIDSKQKRQGKTNLHIDMTPMVDLGFLLITFFIFTATMLEKNYTNLNMPKEGVPTPVAESKSLSMMLGAGNKVYAWNGRWDDARQQKRVWVTDYNSYEGIGKFIRQKQAELGAKEADMVLLIKPTNFSSYQNVIDAIDEAVINDVKRYAIVAPEKEEVNYALRN